MTCSKPVHVWNVGACFVCLFCHYHWCSLAVNFFFPGERKQFLCIFYDFSEYGSQQRSKMNTRISDPSACWFLSHISHVWCVIQMAKINMDNGLLQRNDLQIHERKNVKPLNNKATEQVTDAVHTYTWPGWSTKQWPGEGVVGQVNTPPPSLFNSLLLKLIMRSMEVEGGWNNHFHENFYSYRWCIK